MPHLATSQGCSPHLSLHQYPDFCHRWRVAGGRVAPGSTDLELFLGRGQHVSLALKPSRQDPSSHQTSQIQIQISHWSEFRDSNAGHSSPGVGAFWRQGAVYLPSSHLGGASSGSCSRDFLVFSLYFGRKLSLVGSVEYLLLKNDFCLHIIFSFSYWLISPLPFRPHLLKELTLAVSMSLPHYTHQLPRVWLIPPHPH